MQNSTPVEFQRLRYWQGQKLRGSDFRHQTAIAEQLRWWHNRALHNAFGVARGFEIDVDEQERFVTIQPGVAYDCFGRELLLQTSQTIFFPAVNPGVERTLLVRYRGNSEFPQQEQIDRTCLAGEISLFAEAPVFFWKTSSEITLADGVPLGRGHVDFAEPTPVFKFATMRVPVRALARPRIASGATIPGNTAWESWDDPVLPRSIVVVQVRIDTSTAGFTTVPCYFAWLARQASPQIDDALFPAALTHLEAATTSDFLFRVWLPRLPVLGDGNGNVESLQNFLELAREQQLFVCWMGIQSFSKTGTGEPSEANHGISL